MSWQRVRGHEVQVAAFQQAVRRNRLGHAYLFTGPAGIGKRLFALELAKALLCEGPRSPAAALQACDQCPACLQVEAGTHPDFLLAERPADKHEWPISLMREVLQRFALKPARGRGKVALFDDAEDFNKETANCFLKTLEEPPPGSILILIGTSAERQLPTLVSRCQVVPFAPLPPAEVAQVLRAQHLGESGLIEQLAHLSGGSPGLARELADPELWRFRRTLLQGLLQPRIDSVALARQWMQFTEEAGKESAAQRRRAMLVLRLLLDLLRAALIQSCGGEPRLTDPDDRRAVDTLAARLDPEQLVKLLERCLEANSQLERRAQLVLVLEALLDALSRLLQPV